MVARRKNSILFITKAEQVYQFFFFWDCFLVFKNVATF